MAGMETQRQAAPVWIVLFDRYAARWLFAFIALSALGLALLTVMSHGWVHLVLSLPGHLVVAVVAGGIALLTRSPARRRSAVVCLLGDLVARVPNLLWVGGHQWRGLPTGVLLLPVLVPATRRALSAQPVDATVGGFQPTPEVAAARSEVASQVPAAQVHSFRKPVLVLHPRSGSVQAVRDRLLEAAGRYGVQVREAATPAELVALAREAVADGADVLGVAGGDGSLAAVATVAIEAELPFVCVPAGTRNHFARDLGLDRADPAAAIEAFVAGPERRLDVATVGQRLGPGAGPVRQQQRLPTDQLRRPAAPGRGHAGGVGAAPDRRAGDRPRAREPGQRPLSGGVRLGALDHHEPRGRLAQWQAGGRHRRRAGRAPHPGRIQDPRGRATRAGPPAPARIRVAVEVQGPGAAPPSAGHRFDP